MNSILRNNSGPNKFPSENYLQRRFEKIASDRSPRRQSPAPYYDREHYRGDHRRSVSVSATADQFMTNAAVLVTDPTEGIKQVSKATMKDRLSKDVGSHLPDIIQVDTATILAETITEEASVSAPEDQFMTTAAVLVTDPTEGIKQVSKATMKDILSKTLDVTFQKLFRWTRRRF